MRRVSVLGVALCLLHLAAAAFCVWGALSAQGDPKGHFVLLQLPLTPQLIALDALHADAWLTNMPWATSYALLVPPFLAVLYAVGHAFQWLIARVFLGAK
ncbi:hypothetical protein LN565_19670 [Xanthomonas euvesicatoria pv. euvesicatoria]|uniref:Uncharacterized protein n=3 Tax=Xanthomonas euvesicatoria TaxID=456327 RepID=A0A6B3KK84_XANEU|nr:hypothetical protein [Xanthomonas euvesicatoria]AOY67029.1 hypothetical protein BHE83_10955 [Xanthomonas euvesicatoria pv. vesicatoria str. 85-10]APO89383.1 hypothetical protein BJD11_04290 [Xanthomonas euvesicatoria]KHL62216.1 membrane protein [Xanthomonas euvesicatoria]KHL66450.1 membrane protein [Xanthomonas euvesicatoria]KLA53712.1 membrane protein [Xanthomonas euvesicatoria]